MCFRSNQIHSLFILRSIATENIDMNLIKLKQLRNHFNIYYVLGLNSFVSLENRRSKCYLFVQFLPRTLVVCVHLILMYTTIAKRNPNASFIHGALMNIAIIFTSFMAIIENVKNSKDFFVMLKMMNYTINDLEMGLQIEYPFKIFKAKVQRNYLLTILLIVVGVLVRQFIVSKIGMDPINNILTAFNFLFKYSYVLQITFYIDFVQYTLIGLNAKLSTFKSVWPSDETKNSLYFMRQIKLIHFKVWHISHRVQLIFGWFLVIFVIEIMALSTFSVYWVFLFTEDATNRISVLRKYLSISLFVTFIV